MLNFFKKNKIPNKTIFKKCISMLDYTQNKIVDTRCDLEEKGIIEKQQKASLRAYCECCEQQTYMDVDFLYAGKSIDGKFIPNFRERLVCEQCGLNNRLRATYDFLKNNIKIQDKDVYITEEITPLYNLLKSKTKTLIGSEYFANKKFGRIFIPKFLKKINNEDLTNLSFKNNQFDLVISLEVLEHIPDYKKALQEIYRVMKNDASFVFSIPFVVSSQQNIVRARVVNGVIEHLLPAEYHGDPVDSEGCLCFYHFGWEIFDDLKQIGFIDSGVYSYHSIDKGYLGEGIILYAKK